MPLIVQAKDYARWLDRENAEIADILAPYPAEGMTAYPVSRRVNSPTNDDAKRVSRELAGGSPPDQTLPLARAVPNRLFISLN